MAAPAIVVERFRVEHGEGFTMPIVSLTDRRAAGNRLVRFVFQRHLETVLYGRSEGSSGPIWKVMNAAGIGATTMAVNKASVNAGMITDSEYKELMDAFKSALPVDMVDPSSLGRIRNCTILPLAAAADAAAADAELTSLVAPPHKDRVRCGASGVGRATEEERVRTAGGGGDGMHRVRQWHGRWRRRVAVLGVGCLAGKHAAAGEKSMVGSVERRAN